MNELFQKDHVQLVVKYFQKNFYTADFELYEMEFLVGVEQFDEVEYVNELILDLN
jgi:hypothetical protein